MSDKIFFLGTAGGAEAVNNQEKASGGIIIKTISNQIHIDPGPGAAYHTKKIGINLSETSIILISHGHLSHCADANSIIGAMTFQGRNPKGFLICPEDAYNKFIREEYKTAVKFFPSEISKSFEINNLKIVCSKAQHNAESTGFKIYSKNAVIGYTSDTKYFPSIHKEYEDCDILIINARDPEGKKSEHNLNISDVLKIAGKIKPKLIVLTHFGAAFQQSQHIYDARKIQKETGIQTIAADDGMIVDTDSYAVERQQKTLSGF